MQRRAFLMESGRAALGLSALSVSGCSPRTRNSAGPRDAFLESLVAEWEARIPQWLQEAKMPAVSIAIVRDDQLAWRRAFGVKDTGTNDPVDTESVFAACSDTKPVFAYAVAKLCEKGVMDLDTPLTNYTSRRILADPRLELITARHVLNHTTGFPNWRNDQEPFAIQFTPGTRFQYSGEGFSYLQSVVVEVTGQPFEDFMRDNLLVPFGMTSSGFSWDTAYGRQIAKPHDENGRRIAGKYVTPPSASQHAENLARYGAAASLMTTPTDYARFLLEILNPKPADTYRLSEASRRELLRPQVKKTDTDSEALAWAINQFPDTPAIFTHAGQDAGYYCFTAGSTARKSGLMVMLNGDSYVPILLKMLADPSGGTPDAATIWPDFAKRFFAV